MNLLYPLRRARDLYSSNPAWIEGNTVRTWGDFYVDLERASTWLAGHYAHGDRLALLLSNSPVYLELYYAAAMAGAVVVPLNIRWGIHDFVFSITDSGSRVLVVDHRFAALGRQILERVPGLELIWAGRGECPAGMTDYHASVACVVPAPQPEPPPDQLVGIFYTSGTTGGPKGAMLTHRNLYSNALLCLASGIDLGRVYLHAAPMFHLADGCSLYLAAMLGSAHTFVEVFDAGAVLAAIERHRVTSTALVPTMINLLVNHPDLEKHDRSSLERILYGGSPMPLPLLERAIKAFRCKFYQVYGMTETSPVLTILQAEDHRLEGLDSPFAPVRSAGRPIVGMEVRVVDLEDRPVPVGQSGEIVARGDNVMRGYWNRPEINREVLRGGWMHTGDIGVFDERGFLYILDRTKDMIKTGGENVYSPEVESAILMHEDILEAAVIGVPDERWGETILAVVALRKGASCTAEDVIAHCRARMTHFKCPTSVIFVEALPKGGTGKVQKQVLRAKFARSAAAAS
jgi:long-chain acyl-CoA synthetase